MRKFVREVVWRLHQKNTKVKKKVIQLYGGGPRIYDLRCPWLLHWQFPFSDHLKYDISVYISIFVSEGPLKLRCISVFRHENRSIIISGMH